MTLDHIEKLNPESTYLISISLFAILQDTLIKDGYKAYIVGRRKTGAGLYDTYSITVKKLDV